MTTFDSNQYRLQPNINQRFNQTSTIKMTMIYRELFYKKYYIFLKRGAQLGAQCHF